MTTTIYAVGDIHGQRTMLADILGRIAQDRAEHGHDDAPLVFVGDLVDRGPDSRGVIDDLIAGIDAGENWIVLKGNHDRLFHWFLEDPERRDHCLRADYSWLHPNMGGLETLQSYGIRNTARTSPANLWQAARQQVPTPHRRFLANLATSQRIGGYFFAHAGIRPGVPLNQQSEDDLVWIRTDFHIDRSPHEAVIVHGHTPIKQVTHYGNRINIDTGAAFGRKLSAIVTEGNQVFTLEPDGRKPLKPLRP